MWIDANFQAADAYHDALADAYHERAALMEEFPPTCDVCERSVIEDGVAFCRLWKEWVDGIFECVEPDYFLPMSTWAAYQS